MSADTREIIVLPSTTNTATAPTAVVAPSPNKFLGVAEKDAAGQGIVDLGTIGNAQAVLITPFVAAAGTTTTLAIYSRRDIKGTVLYLFTQLGTFNLVPGSVDAGTGGGLANLKYCTITNATDNFGAAGAYRITGPASGQSLEFDCRDAESIVIQTQTNSGATQIAYSFIGLPE